LASNILNSIPEYDKYYVFVDDCSTDNSVELIKELFNKHSYHIITKDENKGPGDSFNKGFNYIIDHSKSDDDIIVTMEADNTSDINILQKLISINQLGYELVLASVYAQGGGFEETSLFRKIISNLANLILRYFYNIKVQTLSSFYRVYDIKLLKRIKTKYGNIINENGFISMVELLIKSIKSDATIIEVPMKLYSKKRAGKSKMKVFKTMISYIRFLLSSNKL